MKNPQKLSRRRFVGRVALGTGGLLATPHVFLPSTLRGQTRPAAGNRIVMGTIGIGNRGRLVMENFMSNPDVQMVAVCDVWGERRERARALVDATYGNKDCAAYIDMHDMLARPDIEAVLIATGDNNHAIASMAAARAGKDIYCEKPLSVTIAESRAVADTVRRLSRIFQCGMQRRSIGNFQFAVDLARSGKLGRLKTLYAERARWDSGVYFTRLPAQPTPPREVMDWDGWLGAAPWRPYNEEYHARRFWSQHGDFSGGSITEWGSHTVDLCQWANDADDSNPVSYEQISEAGDMEGVYPNGVKLIIKRGLRFGTCPVRFEGEEGWVETGDSGEIETHPASLLLERRFAGGYPPDNHVRAFLDCVRSRRQPVAHAEVAHHSITACHTANVAVRLGRPVVWDPVNEGFANDPEANRLRSRAMRASWQV